MTAWALAYKEAAALARSRWLLICSAVCLLVPVCANVISTNPILPLGDAYLFVCVALSCMGGELVFRSVVSERASGALDVLLVSGAGSVLIVLCKLLLPSLIALTLTMGGMALNDMAAPYYAGKALFADVFNARSAAAAAFSAPLSGALELTMLLRSREALPLRGSTAIVLAVTVTVSCTFLFLWDTAPLLPCVIASIALLLGVWAAAHNLPTYSARKENPIDRPDVLALAKSPLSAVAAKDLAQIRSWVLLVGRFVVLIALAAAIPGRRAWLAAAAWFPALSFGAAEVLYPALVREFAPGAMDVLRTALGSTARVYACKSALAFIFAQCAALFAVIGLGSALIWELYALASLALACAVHCLLPRAESARTGRAALWLALAASYSLCVLAYI